MNVLVGRGYNPTLCLGGGGKEGYLPHIHLLLKFLNGGGITSFQVGGGSLYMYLPNKIRRG